MPLGWKWSSIFPLGWTKTKGEVPEQGKPGKDQHSKDSEDDGTCFCGGDRAKTTNRLLRSFRKHKSGTTGNILPSKPDPPHLLRNNSNGSVQLDTSLSWDTFEYSRNFTHGRENYERGRENYERSRSLSAGGTKESTERARSLTPERVVNRRSGRYQKRGASTSNLVQTSKGDDDHVYEDVGFQLRTDTSTVASQSSLGTPRRYRRFSPQATQEHNTRDEQHEVQREGGRSYVKASRRACSPSPIRSTDSSRVSGPNGYHMGNISTNDPAGYHVRGRSPNYQTGYHGSGKSPDYKTGYHAGIRSNDGQTENRTRSLSPNKTGYHVSSRSPDHQTGCYTGNKLIDNQTGYHTNSSKQTGYHTGSRSPNAKSQNNTGTKSGQEHACRERNGSSESKMPESVKTASPPQKLKSSSSLTSSATYRTAQCSTLSDNNLDKVASFGSLASTLTNSDYQLSRSFPLCQSQSNEVLETATHCTHKSRSPKRYSHRHTRKYGSGSQSPECSSAGNSYYSELDHTQFKSMPNMVNLNTSMPLIDNYGESDSSSEREMASTPLKSPKKSRRRHRYSKRGSFRSSSRGSLPNIPENMEKLHQNDSTHIHSRSKSHYHLHSPGDSPTKSPYRHHQRHLVSGSVPNMAVELFPNDLKSADGGSMLLLSDEMGMDVSMATNASYLPGVSLADKLRLAASKGQIEKVRELVQTGSSFEPDREGRTALHYAALNGYGDVVKFLADQNCDIDAQDNLGYTALHRAAAQGHLEVIRVLLDEGCALDRQDEVHGNAALHEAAWNGYSKTLEVLAKGRANPHVSNKAGFTALHLAAQNGHNQSARVLLYASCNADRKNNYGDTALHTAVRYGHAGVTRILISARCNINEQNKNGDTSLHIAAALKRRKIAKLLTEAGIDVNVRNKQNETAVDVARRKEHPEIIVLITSQPKVKKKKRFGRNKSGDKSDPRQSLDSAEDDKKPEKRGFFFKKKAKTKEKPSSTAAATTASAGVEARPHFDQSMPPEQLLEGFRQHQHMQRGGAPGHAPSKDSLAGPSTSLAQGGAQARGAGPGPKGKRVHGLLNQYVPKNGTQYYRDLAGNVKQGPIGYAPICNCAPLLKKLEQRVEADQANMYDHVQATHKTLVDRMDSVEKRTAQQVYALDKLVKERLDAERREHDKYINSRTVRERIETERQLEHNQDVVRTELKSWVDHRISNIEQKYLPHKNGCDWNHRHGRRYAQCDDMLNRGFNGVHGMETPLPGRLYRSKSDETLSSCNPSKRHFKMRARTMEEIKKLNLPSVANRANKFERKLRSQRQHGEPLSVVVEGKHGSGQFSPVGSGRSPEGKSVHGDFTEYGPIEGGEHAQRMVFEMSDQMSRLGVLDEDQQRSLSDSYAHMLSQSEPDIEGRVRRSLPSQCYTSNPTYTDCQARLTSTPNEVAIHHSKQDSGSNPDSGYGSKIYGNRPGSAKSNSSPISNSQDAHNSSILTNTSDGSSIHSPATFIPGENNPDCLHVTRHFFDTVSTEMEKWYERRLRDVERKAEERVRQEADVMQSRLKALEKRFAGTTATDV